MYAVLTPAVESRFYVNSGVDIIGFVSPVGGVGHFGDRHQTKTLQALVDREAYDPGKPLAERLVQALNQAGHTATHQLIDRRPPGRIQSLSWGDLPELPSGTVLFDVTIQRIGLQSDLALSRFFPAIVLRWRLLDPRGEILEPSRVLVYYHDPAYLSPTYGGKTPTKPPPDPSTVPPEVGVSDACGYHSVETAGENPPGLWACFDEAFQGAIGRLLFELEKIRK